MRRDIGRHAHGNAGGAVQQNVGQTCRQHLRFLHSAVKVRHPVNGALTQLGQQHFRIFGQPRFGITHRGEGFRIVRRTPVPLAVYQRIAIREWLRHQYHSFITGAVAVRMVFTQHITDGTGGFFEFGAVAQPQFRHGVDDAALYRLQTVTDVRQRPIHDDVHGIVQIGVFSECVQR
ncbi:hypothetical protein D3C72_1653790 [compost metagenome]